MTYDITLHPTIGMPVTLKRHPDDRTEAIREAESAVAFWASYNLITWANVYRIEDGKRVWTDTIDVPPVVVG